MTTDRDGLLAAIRERPDDDGLRLIYADWLDEHGEPARAEMIRMMVAAGPTLITKTFPRIRYPSPGEFARDGWGVCEVVTFAQTHAAVSVWLDDPRGDLDYGCLWDRGLITSITCPAADWLAHADGLLAEHPVQDVWLTTWPEINYVDGDSTTTDAFGEHTVYRRAARWGDKTASAVRAVGRREIHERYVRGGDTAVADLSARIRRDLEQMMSPLSLLRQWWPQVPAGGWHLPEIREAGWDEPTSPMTLPLSDLVSLHADLSRLTEAEGRRALRGR